MTFGEMKTEIATRSGDTSTTNKTRAGEFINDIMFRISDSVKYPGEKRWGQLRTESGRFAYSLDHDVAQVIEPMVVVDSNATIWTKSVEKFNGETQNPTSTGVPSNFMYYGNYTLDRQPESKLTFNDPNTASITATIYGMSEFRNITESLALNNGSTTLTTNTFQTVSKITLSAAPTGVNVYMKVLSSNGDPGIARFTSTDTDASTSDYGLWNPGSRIRVREIDTGTTLAGKKTRIRGYTVGLGDSGFMDDLWGEEGPQMGADTTAAGGLGGTNVNKNNGIINPADATLTVTGAVNALIVVGSNISIGTEQMRVTEINSQILTVIRGIFDTTAATHAHDQDISVTNNCHAETSARFTSIESTSMEDNQQTLIVSSLDEYGQKLTKTGDYGRILGVIPFLRQSVDRPIVGLYPIPGGERISYQYYRKMFKLTNDNDRPPMDERVHRYIKKWAESAFLAWFGSNMGIQETIQNALPSWQSDMRTVRNFLGLVANRTIVMGGDAVSMHTRFRSGAVLDPSVY